MEPLRLGIIGAGRLSSRRIYPLLHRLPVELAAVCDLDRARAEEIGGRFGAPTIYTDHKAMLSEAGLDAVIVCVGPEAHAGLAIDVIEHGLPVYTEKPPAMNGAEARQVRDASRQHGVIAMTGFKKRFAPAYKLARTAIESGDFGAPALLSIDYCCGPTYTNDPAIPQSQFLLDFTVHIIDLARYLFGEVVEVTARERDQLTYAVLLSYANGALGTISMSSHRDWAVPTEKVELTGSPGNFISLDNSIEYVRYQGSRIVEHHHPSFSTAGADSLIETGFAGELEEFIRCVQSGDTPESSIESSSRTMALFDAIAASAASGQPCRVEE